ncbi:MAG: class I SAM-dependent methyltransferase [Verrucomicrobiales bacterium]
MPTDAAQPKTPDAFYQETLSRLLREGVMSPTDNVLAACGGPFDAHVLQMTGFTHVTISNLDVRLKDDEFAPFAWSFQDTEQLTFSDGTFDWALVHNGLHHCVCPQRAILELYRVAQKGIVLFEPYDNWLTRLGVWLGFGQEYEHAAVYYNDMKFGGVRNSPIPNYVYRITRREIKKTILCGRPEIRAKFRFFHRMRLPWGQLEKRRNPFYYAAVRIGEPLLNLISRMLPGQSNCFAAVVQKPRLTEGLHPWLTLDADGKIVPNAKWLERRYQSLPPVTPEVGRPRAPRTLTQAADETPARE